MEDRRLLLTPAEAGARFGVSSKTITQWAKSGKIPPEAIVWTIGGQRRYIADMLAAPRQGES